MQFVSVSDLIDRWLYTPQGARKIIKSADFPASVFAVNRGRVPVWELPHIEAWEADHPEVTDPGIKIRKQRGYFLARRKGPSGENPSQEAQP